MKLGMKRLIYCAIAILLMGTPAVCFGRSPQAIGEMVHLGAATPSSPASPARGRSNLPGAGARTSRTARDRNAASGGVVNYHWKSSEEPTKKARAQNAAKKGGAIQEQRDAVIYGADAPDESDTLAKQPKAQAAPAKATGPGC